MPSNPVSPKVPEADKQKISPDSLPRLNAIAPAIFLPITEDLTAPLTAVPASKTVRLQNAIEQHVKHSKAVQANIMNYHRREIFRLSLDPTEQQPVVQEPPSKGLSEKDRAQLIENLEAPPDPSYDYKSAQANIPWPRQQSLPTNEMRTLAKAMLDVEGYRNNANKRYEQLKNEWTTAKDRENS